jgi:hypothetical protein
VELLTNFEGTSFKLFLLFPHFTELLQGEGTVARYIGTETISTAHRPTAVIITRETLIGTTRTGDHGDVRVKGTEGVSKAIATNNGIGRSRRVTRIRLDDAIRLHG